MLKDFLDILIEPIYTIINKSLKLGIFPERYKTAHVKPLLKKATLSKNDLKNYRPVSNLSFVSKILEKIVASRLHSHINTNNLTNKHQSAYKQFHSTESALLKVENDILLNMDKGHATAVILLDLSAAFDTIDHSILFDRLLSWYGITGLALGWFKSYLGDRYQQIKLKENISNPVSVPFGVPQGSVLGPILSRCILHRSAI